jgi:hypothetical protein
MHVSVHPCILLSTDLCNSNPEAARHIETARKEIKHFNVDGLEFYGVFELVLYFMVVCVGVEFCFFLC